MVKNKVFGQIESEFARIGPTKSEIGVKSLMQDDLTDGQGQGIWTCY